MNTTPKRIGKMIDGQPQLFDEWQPITKSDPAVIGNIVTYDGGRTFDRVGYDPRRDCLMLDNVTEMVMAAMEVEAERIYQTAERVVIGLEDACIICGQTDLDGMCLACDSCHSPVCSHCAIQIDGGHFCPDCSYTAVAMAAATGD